MHSRALTLLNLLQQSLITASPAMMHVQMQGQLFRSLDNKDDEKADESVCKYWFLRWLPLVIPISHRLSL